MFVGDTLRLVAEGRDLHGLALLPHFVRVDTEAIYCTLPLLIRVGVGRGGRGEEGCVGRVGARAQSVSEWASHLHQWSTVLFVFRQRATHDNNAAAAYIGY